MNRGLVLVVGLGLVGVASISGLLAQSPQVSAKPETQDAVFRFRLLGPTTDTRAKLSDERRWQTQTGLRLAGQATVARQAEHIEIERVNHNGAGPGRVTLPVSALTEADQATIRAAWPNVKPEARQLGLLVPFAVKPQWSKATPKIANRYSRAIAVEANQIIFRSGAELYAVPKAAFTPASYNDIASLFTAHHAGRYIQLRDSFTSVSGKLLSESESDFIFEAVDPPQLPGSISPGSIWQAGQRFRVPKLWLSKLLVEDLKQLIKRFPLKQDVAALATEQLISLPSLRRIDNVLRFCQSDPNDSNTLLCLDAKGQKRREPISKLVNREHLASALELLSATQPSLDKKQAEAAALEQVVALGRQRESWEYAESRLAFSGRLLGKLRDVYVFDDIRSKQPFYALRDQLSEFDQKIIESVCKQQTADWNARIDLVTLFSNRLLVNNGYALVARLGTRSADVHSAFEGQLPIIEQAANIEYPWPALDIENIDVITRARKFVATHRAILAAHDLPKLNVALNDFSTTEQSGNAAPTTVDPASISSDKRPATAAAEGSATASVPGARADPASTAPLTTLPKRDSWKLLDSDITFIGELAGEYEGQWVFEVMVNEQRKSFLASPTVLSPDAKRKGEAILKRVEKRAWDELLTRSHNWQYFRVWYDASGKVRSSTSPVVVLSISDALIRFQHLDGSTSSNPVPIDEAKREELVEFFEPAFEQGRKLRSRAEEGLTLWKFQDCEPTQRATLVAESSEDILVKDSRGAEFLINKACLDASSIDELNKLRESTPQLRVMSDQQARALPRVWCTRTRLIGPATAVYMTSDNRLELLFTDGTRDFISVESLTLRERLAYENQWRRFHSLSSSEPQAAAKNDAAPKNDPAELLSALRAEIAERDKVQSLPALRPEVVQAINANVASWQHKTWQSTPLNLEPAARLMAINEDAAFGVIAEANQWYVVELASGKRKLIRKLVSASAGDSSEKPGISTNNGSTVDDGAKPAPRAPLWAQSCWMHRGAKVYWLEQGQVHVSGNTVDASKALTVMPESIVAAAQSSDYSALVLLLADASVHRFDLASETVTKLADAPDERAPKAASLVIDTAQAPPTNGLLMPPLVWASSDGTAYTAFADNAILVRVPARSENEVNAQAFLATNKAPLHVALNRDAALVQFDNTGSLSKLTVSASTPAPTRTGLPFDARWYGIVKWPSQPGVSGDDVEKEVIQLIGKPADNFFHESNYFFVHQHRLDGDYDRYAYQYVQGELNDHVRIAANGAAIVHHREGKYVVSRRPAVIPIALTAIIYPYIREFVEQHDVGQLEALGRHLEQARFQAHEGPAGWISHRYQDLVKVACFEYRPELGGDRLARALALADHMWRKYPASQVAGNVLVDIHRNLAWSARGGGYIGTVTDAGRDSFHREMKIAQDYLATLMKSSQPIAPTFRSAIDIEMATTQSLEGPRKLAVRLLNSPHVADAQLQTAMTFMLFPRWHGAPGMSEAYMQTVSSSVPEKISNTLYAQQVALLMPMLGYAEPVTTQLQIDLEKVFKGTKEYYASRSEGNLLDTVILIMAVEQKYDWVRELMELRAEKRILPSSTAAAHAQSFRNLEAKFGK